MILSVNCSRLALLSFLWSLVLDGFQAVLIGRSTRTTQGRKSERYLQPSVRRAMGRGSTGATPLCRFSSITLSQHSPTKLLCRYAMPCFNKSVTRLRHPFQTCNARGRMSDERFGKVSFDGHEPLWKKSQTEATQQQPLRRLLQSQHEGAGAVGSRPGREKAAAEAYIKQRGGEIIGEYQEVETGKDSQRPEILKAILFASRSWSTLVIARLDRLSRSLWFCSTLMESGIDFICCDNPQASRLTIHIMASIAEEEARLVSCRQKTLSLPTKHVAACWGRLHSRIGKDGNKSKRKPGNRLRYGTPKSHRRRTMTFGRSCRRCETGACHFSQSLTN